MIQDIHPDRLENTYAPRAPKNGDAMMLFSGEGKTAVRIREGRIFFPTEEDAGREDAVYLFSISGRGYYLASGQKETLPSGFEYRSLRELRETCTGKEMFAAFTAYHLWRWYADNRRCGRCGGENAIHEKERALRCRVCGHTVWPRINPAVIVGVIRGDCLLITRYRTGYGHNALVAGFTEIGETLEETVGREVMEETGIRVRNIRYYRSQPWGIAQDLLAGFWCEAEEPGEIRMDPGELKYAEWVRREDIVLQPDNLSLTNEMMKRFKENGADSVF